MKKAKKQLARTVPFKHDDVYGGVRFSLYRDARPVSGAVGKVIRERFSKGKAVFLDKKPPDWSADRILVLGVPGGVVLSYYPGYAGYPVTEFRAMCSTFRGRLVGGIGKTRWARLKAT